MDIAIEQLKAHFGSTSLIARIKEINPKTREGILEAYQVDKGEPWLYTDGRPVDDITYTFNGETAYKKDNWVLIDSYDFIDGSAHLAHTPRLKALHIRPLTEVAPLCDRLQENGVPPDRQLSTAIRNVQLVGEKLFILQDYLDKEREKIKKQWAAEEARLHNWAGEIEADRQALEQALLTLKQERLTFLAECEEYYNQREALQKADALVEARLQSYGLTQETVATGQLQLSDDLIKLLLAQPSVYERLRQERIAELADLEQGYEQWKAALEAQSRENMERERESTEQHRLLLAKEQAVEERTNKLIRWQQDIKELQEILLPIKKPKTKAIAAPIYPFAGEEAVVGHIKDYIQARGFYYAERLLENFYTCLKTDYLVILSGISGTGKSKLPQLFAEAIGAEFELIPVRPNWNDDRDLLGLFSARVKRYQSTRFIEFLLRANADQERLYIVCLDEMNLAPVEYYFAQLLSVLESDNPQLKPPDESLTAMEVSRFEEKALIELGRLQEEKAELEGVALDAVEREMRLWSQALADLEKYQEIPIPPNVRFVGTVNIDHTTHSFSDKVLDRANVIQFERVDLSAKLEVAQVEAKGLGYSQFADYCILKNLSPAKAKNLQICVDQVRQINEILEPSGMNIGFRIFKEIERYMHYVMQSSYFDQPEVAFDFQIKQRILPKLRGMESKELKQALDELATLFKEKYTMSHEKIAGRQRNGKEYGGLLQQLAGKGYINYWEVR
ncbi:MAG: hypothetical protein DYG89_04260 [Caldilinea sp. CFX5]|nr:hypothetical protein [Caldilinea sp. CFX5]